MTAAYSRSHAIAVGTVVQAHGLANALDLLVTELASADVRAKAVGVIGTRSAADWLADTIFRAPTVLTGALVGPGTCATVTTVVAMRFALVRLRIARIALAAVDYGYPSSVVVLIREERLFFLNENQILKKYIY